MMLKLSYLTCLTTLLAESSFGATPVIEAQVWNTIANDEDEVVAEVPSAAASSCGLEKHFNFGAYKGTTPQKIIIEFESGGICTNGNCSLTRGDARCFRRFLGNWTTAEDTYLELGFHNHAADWHPLKSWSHIFIPYCTCDFHLGDQDVIFSGEDLTDFTPLPDDAQGTPEGKFSFRGFNNFQFAMDWLSANLEQFEMNGAPTDILVAGSSAGGFGASVLQEHIIQRFPESKISSLIDSAYGPVGYFNPELYVNFEKETTPFSLLESDSFDLEETKSNLATRSFSKVQQAVADKYLEHDFVVFAYTNDSTIGNSEELLNFVEENDKAGRCNLATWLLEGALHAPLWYGVASTVLPDGSLWRERIAQLADSDTCVGSIVTEEAGLSLCLDICPSCSSTCDDENDDDSSINGAGAGVAIVIVAVALTLLFVAAKRRKDREVTTTVGQPEA